MRTQNQIVYVRNVTEDTLRSRYDGEDFEFAPGVYVQCPIDAARLIFGFGEEDKSRAIQRLGWVSTMNDMPRAIQRLMGFQFHMEVPANAVLQTAPQGETDPDSESDQGEGDGNTDGDVKHSSLPPSKNLLAKLAAASAGG
jgi:transcription initiation factor TFIIIB Brf1 subunit/transcription initiation factor TFIIB